jgi:predicted HAD superfamily Cof-like phosphohydrolase
VAYSNVASFSDVNNGLVRFNPSYHPMEKVKEFHDTFSPDQHKQSTSEKVDRRLQLIREEYMEVMDALNHYNRTLLGMTSYEPEESLVEVAGELADLLYMVYGTADELGIPLERIFLAVPKANLRKRWADGQVHRNEFGKVLKPPNFQKANIGEVMYGSLETSSEQ